MEGTPILKKIYLKVAAPIIDKPISDLFNPSLLSEEVPIAWNAATVHPLFKGGNQADPNCCRPISILPCLSKVLERRVNNQLTAFLDVYSILSGMQSGFCSGYGCVTATLKVVNDVTIALDSKQCCAAILIELAKAFDTVDHSILVSRLGNIGVSEGTLTWFVNHLSQRVQCIKS